jgi:hypothetical protein
VLTCATSAQMTAIASDAQNGTPSSTSTTRTAINVARPMMIIAFERRPIPIPSPEMVVSSA